MCDVLDCKKYKVLIIGDPNVGKTSLLLRHTDGYFDSEGKHTIGVDFRTKHYIRNNKRRDLNIWDTAGQERFRNITKAYYRGANGVFLIFDLNNIDSFKPLTDWITYVLAETENKPVFILVGNKSDLPRQVPHEMVQEFTNKYSISCYLETSAKDNCNVDRMFDVLLELMEKGGGDVKGGGNGGLKLHPSSSVYKRDSNCCN
jgi:small GTP-binding protein